MAFQFFLKMDHLESSRIENLFMDIRGFQGRGSFKGKVGNKMIEYQYSIIKKKQRLQEYWKNQKFEINIYIPLSPAIVKKYFS